jgi:hypothetical protein
MAKILIAEDSATELRLIKDILKETEKRPNARRLKRPWIW